MNRLKKNYHWLVMISCCLMASASVGFFTNAYGVFYTPLSESLGAGRGAVAMHATIAGLLTGFAGPVVVKVLQKVRLQIVIGTGIVLLVISTVLTACAANVWQLNILGILRGIGCACYYIPVITIILGNWFSKYYGTVSGITLSFSGIAGAILSPCFSEMISREGYRNTLFTGAALILVLSLPGMLICRLNPAEMGLKPYGGITKAGEQGRVSTSERQKTDRTGSKRIPFLLLGTVGFLALFIIGMTQHMTGYSESIGMGTATGVAMMSAVMIGNIATKLLIGIVSDMIGAAKASAAFMAAAVAALLVMLFYPVNTLVLLAAAFLIGGVYAVGAVGLAGVSKQLYGKARFGEVFAEVSVVTCLSISVALTAIGYTYDATGGYALALGIAVLFGILSVIGLVILDHFARLKEAEHNKEKK